MAAATASMGIRRGTHHRGVRCVSRGELNGIQRDVRTLRSLLISLVGEDREGVYRPAFIRDLLAASVERPTRKFRGADQFLRDIAGL